MVYSWSTTKTDKGYEFKVYTVAYQQPSVVLNSGVRPTRAKAASIAKKWKMYHTKMLAKAAA